MIRFKRAWLWMILMAAMGASLTACKPKSEQEEIRFTQSENSDASEKGEAKKTASLATIPMPRRATPSAATTSPSLSPALQPTPSPDDPLADPLQTLPGQSPTTVTDVLVAPAELTSEAAAVFEAMDRRFEQSTARTAEILGRIEMVSSVRSYRSFFGFTIKAEFPNKLLVLVSRRTEIEDPQTTTGIVKSPELTWGLISDGAKMAIRKGLSITQDAPKTLDDMIDQQIEIDGYGESAFVNSFMRTRPSLAFKPRLKRARVLGQDAQDVRLELVMAPTHYVVQKYQMAADLYDVTYEMTVDAPTSIPRRIYADLRAQSEEIFRRNNKSNVKVESASLEIIARSVDMNARFTDPETFKIPEGTMAPTTGTMPFIQPRTGPLPIQPTTATAPTTATPSAIPVAPPATPQPAAMPPSAPTTAPAVAPESAPAAPSSPATTGTAESAPPPPPAPTTAPAPAP